ncbi:Chromosome segregation ATPase [gamma proteobacterium HdN1]|nr:Chromosome segregation ATPase [gamma proteobacterium HdN1]
MRLKSIKIAGFKSFVDPTHITFPDNLTAVVGPNGCGKSNTIDAVRWVMGESSAKNLRGESMADVIFNGSSTRKPTVQASVELIFDNSDGSLRGEYINYAEISIRRVATRDGQSQYFLNGTKCRRKDITDIFLGTGLGPRSYAIIEQGMISRLIEAKPEDLRIFIEEAAGISKYKERRKETESRMQRTRENLDRLEDIREELGRQLQHLERQAAAAEKYRQYREEERLLKAQLQVMRYQRFHGGISERETAIRDLETRFEARVADQRNADAEIERLRDVHTEISDQLNEVQARYYGLGAEIARIEQTLHHTKERNQQLRTDLQEAMLAARTAESQQQADEEKLEDITGRLLELEPEQELAEARSEEAANALADSEEALQRWQHDWEQFNQRASAPQQRAHVEQSRIQHLEQSVRRLQERIERLQREQETLDAGPLQIEVEALESRCADAEDEHESLQAQLQETQDAIRQQRDTNGRTSNELDAAKSQLNTLRGRHASLLALQQAARGDQHEIRWLEQRGLASNARLAQQINVESGWERAVETVLGDCLQAVCVDQLANLPEFFEGFEHGKLSFASAALSSDVATPKRESLAARVSGNHVALHLLQGVYAANDLAAALALQPQLNSGESVITREGIWLGRDWLKVQRQDQAGLGVLARQKDLEETQAQLELLDEQVETLNEQLQNGRDQLREHEDQREAVQRELTAAHRSVMDLKAQRSAKEVRLEQLTMRSERIQRERDESAQQYESEREEIALARAAHAEAMDTMSQDADQREAMQGQRESLRNAVDTARSAARECSEALHRFALEAGSLRAQETSTRQGLDRLRQQLDAFDERREHIEEQLAQGDTPSIELQESLEDHLNRRLSVEQELGDTRRKSENCEHELRATERRRQEAERAAQEVRSELERQRLQWQGLQIERKTVLDQLAETSFQLEEVLSTLPPEANEVQWQQELERTANRISRLGAINLAAIDEFHAQSERKEYLDAQHKDLIEALSTLENAIRKIDRETRERFQETFDKVNRGLQTLFPKVFGGGSAYLELTGEDLLDTGVAIMARPPGKKNSTIHLLSGGEKALTAIALVFSIFQLNPAPFCMLDEVDAPLDDANVGRYSRMVEEMSSQVQFIYITHNKIAMEMAHQLLGVTMHEPGVSRLVSVDVEQAAALAAL